MNNHEEKGDEYVDFEYLDDEEKKKNEPQTENFKQG
jgi:hypothetical protein